MILTTSMLTEQLHKYSDPAGKILRMKKDGKIFQLTRGLYETDRNVQGHCLAGAIFGPSYLSFDYALSVYGLIPEAVYAFTSGMRFFGKQEMEILGSSYEPDEVLSFMYTICEYVIVEDIELKDGETIGFSEDQKLPIKLSKGVSVPGDTLKITL